MTSEAAALAEGGPGAAETVRLSVIIVNWNTADLLSACLASLKCYLQSPACQIIVVDNASSDSSAEMVREKFPAVELIVLPENVGFSRGNNAGIERARGEFILLLNSDTEVCDDALWILCDFLAEHPKAGAVGAQLISPDGSIQESCRSFPSHRTALFNRKSLLTRLFPSNRFSRAYLLSEDARSATREVDWVMGAALMTRRTVIEQVGMLDPSFFMYAEDVDWCYRMHKAGWKIFYVPEAKILHHYEKSAAKAPFRMIWERHRSMWRFYKKHYSSGIWMDALTWSGIGVRMLTLSALNLFRRRRAS